MTIPPRLPDEAEEDYSARKAHVEAVSLEDRKAEQDRGATSPLERFARVWGHGSA